MKTAAELQAAQQRENLCFTCRHYDVCEMAGAVLRVEREARVRHFVVISQCAHHEPEEAPGARAPR